VRRGTELAAEQGLTNVEFKVMDALNQEHSDDTFDLVWACESGEHMPDKVRRLSSGERCWRLTRPAASVEAT
jgi:tocopherol O-methyltransferase